MATSEYPLFIINSFTKAPFTGNPAAVCLVKKSRDPSDQLKQKLATEMSLSETAFITTLSEDEDFSTASRFGLRWFTPANEVKLCGHATLASSVVLFNCLGNPNEAITFDTLSGALVVRKTAEGKISMDLPSSKPDTQDEKEVKDLIKIAVGTLPYQDVQYSAARQILLIRLHDKVTKSEFQSQTPPANLLLHAQHNKKMVGLILTLKGSAENGCTRADGTVYDFVSRYFGPWEGVAEDPVCGSAHTVLGPYWAQILGKKQLLAHQCSKRSGELLLDTSNPARMILTGDAFVSIKGSVNI